MATTTTFEQFREEVTGWVRPGHHHGCAPVEVIPGLWTANYADIDSVDKLKKATDNAPIALVVNSALCQCASRTGFYGPDVIVLEVDIEDDPEERKNFDQGKEPSQSKCRDSNVELKKRCAGSMMEHFDVVADAIHKILSSKDQQHVMVHCKASLSRSNALIMAYMMKYKNMTLTQAGRLMKSKWDATWPCDRFTYELCEYERQLRTPHQMTSAKFHTTIISSVAVGALLSVAGLLLVKKK